MRNPWSTWRFPPRWNRRAGRAASSCQRAKNSRAPSQANHLIEPDVQSFAETIVEDPDPVIAKPLREFKRAVFRDIVQEYQLPIFKGLGEYRLQSQAEVRAWIAKADPDSNFW